jgi:hypothetical protein
MPLETMLTPFEDSVQLILIQLKWLVCHLLTICFFTFDNAQGELEHRFSKARYRRTDRKSFHQQIAKIERRQRRLHRIREKCARVIKENLPRTLEEHHHIGRSEIQYKHIGTFLHHHSGDPATKVSLAFFLPIVA